MSLCVCFAVFGCYAQNNFKVENNQLVITEVVQTEGKTQDVLFQDALLWVTSTFKDPKTVIQVKDKDLGLITLKTRVVSSNDYYGNPSQWYDINMSIQVKEGRYKYEIKDIIYNFDLSDIGEFIREPINVNDSVKIDKVVLNHKPIILTLKKQMSKQQEDW